MSLDSQLCGSDCVIPAGIIDPRDTRKVLGKCLQICAQRPVKPMDVTMRPFGVFRM